MLTSEIQLNSLQITAVRFFKFELQLMTDFARQKTPFDKKFCHSSIIEEQEGSSGFSGPGSKYVSDRYILTMSFADISLPPSTESLTVIGRR